MVTLVALLVGAITALAHGATAIQADYTAEAIFMAEQPGILAVLAFEGPTCGPFGDEPCYVIVWHDFTVEVGP